ncbi:MAG: GNAT family N-acetyltransferase, partial [Burkholderiales bacterium]
MKKVSDRKNVQPPKRQRTVPARRGRPAAAGALAHRIRRLRTGRTTPAGSGEWPSQRSLVQEAVLDCGWGRLLFGHTFGDADRIADVLAGEGPERRDIAIYVRDPHVVLAKAPQDLFLDPSHTYRIDLSTYRPARRRSAGFVIRRLASSADADAINRIYLARGMVPVAPQFMLGHRDSRTLVYLVAEDPATGAVIGTVTGVDHGRAFDDPERGASLWCLAVDPQAPQPGIGESLVRHLLEHFQARGAHFVDLSVLHDNVQAIGLYERLGFARQSLFTVKRKNPINERLFVGDAPEAALNPYARIIVDEARRRGIGVEIIDAEGGLFRLEHGGR